MTTNTSYIEHKNSKTFKFLLSLFILIWLIKALETQYLFSHGDALSYHIVWPGLILEHGWKKVFQDFNSIWLSGLFDAIYFLPHLLFSSKESIQRASQFIHFFFSIGLASIIPLFFIKNKTRALLIGLSLLTISKSSDMFLYAKNDGFVAFMALLSFFIIKSSIKYKGIFLGLIFGLAMATKLSAVFIFLPLGLLFLYISWKSHSVEVIKLLIISLTISAPIFYLKWTYQENPFYPGLMNLFPGDMPEAVRQSWMNFMSKPIDLNSFIKNIFALFTGKILFLLSIPLVLIKTKPSYKIAFYLSLSSFFLYLLINGGVVSPRFYFSCYFLLAFFCVSTLFSLSIKNKLLFYFLLFLVLIDSKIDKSVNRIKDTFLTKTSRRQLIPRSQIWDYIPRDSRILTLEFPELYYSKPNIWLDSMKTDTQGYLYAQSCEPMGYYDYFISPMETNIEGCLKDQINQSSLIKTISGLSIYSLKQ